jgi:hypothetical protein
MTTDQLSALLAQDPAAVLEHDRRLYEQQIVRAADLIAAHAQERPAVLLAGLWITGRDGKMLTYGALVLACATSHAVGQRLWSK